MRKKICVRFERETARQEVNASPAALTAASISSGVAKSTAPV